MGRKSSRRTFLRRSFAAGAGLYLAQGGSAAHAAYPWTPGKLDYRDPVTGAKVRVLVSGESHDQVVYQAHPMWLEKMRYLIFNSDRTGELIPHARQMGSGIVRPLATEAVDTFVLAAKSNRLFLAKGRTIAVQYVLAAFQRLRTAVRITELPAGVARVEGGLTLDATKAVLYAAVAYEDGSTWGILALNPKRREWATVATVEFQIAHLQAHPLISGLLMFGHETGGDSPQRIWRAEVGGGGARPYYRETFGEYVMHETWWGPNKILFTIWPYDEEHTEKLYGLVSVDLEGRDLRLYAHYPIWHVHGSPDGRWVLGDDLDRNIWLIDARTGERRLLTQGHNGPGFETHPHASFTPDNRSVVFESSRLGTRDVFLVEIPEWNTLPPAEVEV